MGKKLPFAAAKLNDSQPVAAQIYEFLRERIIDNSAPPGTALSENELASMFAVSRQPVREALTKLEHDHLIEIKPQRGSFVTKISVPNLLGICFVRCSIECSAIYAGLKLNDAAFKAVIDRLHLNLEAQKALQGDNIRLDFLKLDDEFHSIICSFSGSQLPWEILQGIKSNMDRIRFFTLEKASDPADLIKAHAQILQCIEHKDYHLASGLLNKHLYEISETYTQVMADHSEWFELDSPSGAN
ncbi:MAG: GntR family transcriptional regulator [Proteobacteria bacterium]|uniref:GntR family transcriptional regulator n=1 Tax=Candidatus Avisuccinivibrio stercorigallinarum TaxID=2840704 RepID=A0A9D9GS32_9GAMM|nr:GntR family transcriptional regulator [Candidatus Avisuccinivibrio stercorigallinarum]